LKINLELKVTHYGFSAASITCQYLYRFPRIEFVTYLEGKIALFLSIFILVYFVGYGPYSCKGEGGAAE